MNESNKTGLKTESNLLLSEKIGMTKMEINGEINLNTFLAKHI